MPNITIGTQLINFPDSGEDANWSQAIIDFAEAVALQLASISSAFDISPRVQTLSSDGNTNLDVNDAVFPSGSVRSFNFNYAVYRTNGVTNLAETGYVNGVFNTATSTWVLQHEFSGPRQSNGVPYHTFSMSGDQLQISTVALGGAYDNVNSKLSYAAKTILVSN